MTDPELIAGFLAASADLSVREAAEAAGVSTGAIQRWKRGEAASLHPSSRRQLRAFLEQRDAPAPSEPLDLPDGAFLKPRAQAFYRERLGEYLTRGWPDAMVREAARSLISALDGGAAVRDGGAGRADELSEADQLLALTAGAVHVEKYIGARWRRST